MTETTRLVETVNISRLGQRGEGIAERDGAQVFVPHALPGETVRISLDGERGQVLDVLRASPDRIAAFCPHYGVCGGCAIQVLAAAPYAAWKRGLVDAALTRAGIETAIAPLADAHGEGRRRATFHAGIDTNAAGHMQVQAGFMEARAHRIVTLDACPILAPALHNAPQIAQALAEAAKTFARAFDIAITATLEGLDIDLRGTGPLEPRQRQLLVAAAERLDLVRLSNHGVVLIERRPAQLRMGKALVLPPPGAFLQATEAGEAALGAEVLRGVGAARRIADLFAGVGTFALRMAERAEVHAVESDGGSLAALARASRTSAGLREVTTEARDLVRRPMTPAELDRFDAVVLDPPRAGAQEQAEALAQSQVPVVVSVSCAARTFARDAATLAKGGYVIDSIVPFDQFRHSPHVEIVGVFRRNTKRSTKKRSGLLG